MDSKQLTVIEHLDELRSALFRSLLAVCVTLVVALFCLDSVFEWLIYPLERVGLYQLHFFSPYEAFLAKLKVALGVAVVLALPVLLWEVWRFVAPAFLTHEKRLARLALWVSVALFALGLSFAYYVILPISLSFLLSFETSFLTPMLSVGRYISFMLLMLLVFGFMFLLPVFILSFVYLGLVDHFFLARHRKVVAVGILVVSALLTPPDVVTQVLLALPVYGLYELTVIVARWMGQRRSRHRD